MMHSFINALFYCKITETLIIAPIGGGERTIAIPIKVLSKSDIQAVIRFLHVKGSFQQKLFLRLVRISQAKEVYVRGNGLWSSSCPEQFLM